MPGRDQPDRLLRLALRQSDLELGMVGLEPGDRTRQDRPRRRGEPRHLQIAVHPVALPVQFALGLLHLGQDGVRPVGQQDPAAVRRTPRPYGSISRWPTSRCSLPSCWETAEGVRCSAEAAPSPTEGGHRLQGLQAFETQHFSNA